MKIFIVNGHGNVGKTEFENYVISTLWKTKNIYAISTIDYVKECAKKMGWDGSKEPADRRFLSDIKDALTRWNDIPYKKITYWIENNKDKYDAVFIDCREPEEIKRFVNDYGATTILVTGRKDLKSFGNHADDNVKKYKKYDIIINNNSDLDNLYSQAKQFIKDYITNNEEDFS